MFSFVEFCLWNAQDDQTNYQRNLSIGEVEVEQDGPHGSAIYHRTEYRERRDHYAVFGVNARADGFDTDRDTFVGAVQQPGRGRGARAPASRRTRWPRAGTRSARTRSASTSSPGETRDLVIVLGYVENPEDAKWADDAHQVVNKERRPRPAEPVRDRGAGGRGAGGPAGSTGPTCCRRTRCRAPTRSSTGWSTSGTSTSAWSRSTCPARRRTSRPGSAAGWASATRTRTCSGFVHLIPERARERILDIAATQFPDGSAYHQYQPLTKRGNNDVGSGFNDDPLWLIAGRGRVRQGDRRLLDPRRAGALRQRRGARRVAVRAPDALVRVHRHPPRTARAAAHRTRRLERLPQPQLLLDHARASRSRPPRTRRAASPSRCSSPRSSCSTARSTPSWPTPRPALKSRPRADGLVEDDARRRARPRLGRRVVPARVRLLRQRRSAPTPTPRARSGSSRRASPSWPASAAETDGGDAAARCAHSTPSSACWARRTGSSCSTRPTRPTRSSSARSRRTRRATRRTAASSATTTRG